MSSHDKIPHQDLVEEVIDERLERYAAKGHVHSYTTGIHSPRFTGDVSDYDIVDDALVSTVAADTPGEPVGWLEFDTVFYQAGITVEVDLDPDGWIYVDQVKENVPNVHYIFGRRGIPGLVDDQPDSRMFGSSITGSQNSNDQAPYLSPSQQMIYNQQTQQYEHVDRLWLSLVCNGYDFYTALYSVDPEKDETIIGSMSDNSDTVQIGLGLGGDMRKRPRFGIGGVPGAAKVRNVRVKNLVA